MATCGNCFTLLKIDSSRYCSNQCQLDFQYKSYIHLWKQGVVDGNRGINTRNVSGHLIRYLHGKYNNGCALCGWKVKNPITETIPLEIDHIDGNAENNDEDNLRMICPNCHSLTPSYRNLNKGLGRSWRRLKYLKV